MLTKYDRLNHQRIIERYKVKSLRDVAIEFGVSTGTIKKVLMIYNVEMRPKGGVFNRKGGMKNDVKFKAEVIRLYFDEGLTLVECGRRLGTSGNYLARLMQTWGLSVRKPKYQLFDADEIVWLYTEKMLTIAFIAVRFESSPSVIIKILESEGVPRRTPAERKALIEKRRNADKSPKTVLVVPDVPDTSIADQILMMREQQNAKVQDIAAVLDVSTVDVFDVIRAAGAL